MFPVVASVLQDVRNNSSKKDLLTTPAPLLEHEYILFSHFVELFEPLCILTDVTQGDKINSPLLIPKLLETYARKFTYVLLFNLFLLFFIRKNYSL